MRLHMSNYNTIELKDEFKVKDINQKQTKKLQREWINQEDLKSTHFFNLYYDGLGKTNKLFFNYNKSTTLSLILIILKKLF